MTECMNRTMRQTASITCQCRPSCQNRSSEPSQRSLTLSFMQAQQPAVQLLSSLQASTAYTLWVIAEDVHNNTQAAATQLLITTVDLTPPAFERVSVQFMPPSTIFVEVCSSALHTRHWEGSNLHSPIHSAAWIQCLCVKGGRGLPCMDHAHRHPESRLG